MTPVVIGCVSPTDGPLMRQQCPSLEKPGAAISPTVTNRIHHTPQKRKRIDYPFNISINVLFRASACPAIHEMSMTVTIAFTSEDVMNL